MLTRPVRGPAVSDLGLALPPAAMPGWRRGRPLKRWRWVGVFTPELELCVADARIGPVPRRWWAIAFPDGRLREHAGARARGVRVQEDAIRVRAGDVRIELALDVAPAVQVVSPAERGGYVWTAKRAGVAVRGTVRVAAEEHTVDGPFGFVDDSAGYHDRRTSWRWSAGIGRADDGRAVGWNLVEGIHDDPEVSERTLWIDGDPCEIEPVVFDPELRGVNFAGGEALAFRPWSVREESTNLLIVRSRYRQPFGSFSGRMPSGVVLAEGYGVMEEHDVSW